MKPKFPGFKATLTLKVKVRVTSFQIHLRHLEKKQKSGCFKANLTLKAKVKVTSFQTHLRHLDARKTFQVGRQNSKQFNFSQLKQKFWKFEGQFDLIGQDQGHQF